MIVVEKDRCRAVFSDKSKLLCAAKRRQLLRFLLFYGLVVLVHAGDRKSVCSLSASTPALALLKNT